MSVRCYTLQLEGGGIEIGDTDFSNTSYPLNLLCAAQFVIITLCDPYNFFLTFIFYFYVYGSFAFMYICATPSEAREGERLELQPVVNPHVGARNKSQILWNSSQ